MPELTVKLDSVARLRELGRQQDPDPAAAAILAELAGAHRIALHLYRRRGQTLDRDARILRHVVRTELAVEMSPGPEMVGAALDIRPDRVVLTAENPKSPAVQEGIDLLAHRDAVAEAVKTLQNGGIAVCLCIEPDAEQIKMAHKLDAAMVQLHAGAFGLAKTTARRKRAFTRIAEAVHLAARIRLGVGVGHGLSYQNVGAFRGLAKIDEFTVGQGIVARAVLVGLDRAVREMLARIHA